MLRFTLYIACLFPMFLGSQTLLDTLAVEICDCMTEAPEIVYPRIQAANCVNLVAELHARQIKLELQLSADNAADRQSLGNLLIDRLTAGCPVLYGLTPEAEEVKLYYNDIPLSKRTEPKTGPKNPPPDPLETTLREGQELYQAEGTFVGISADGELLVRFPSGRQYSFLAQSRQLRRLDLRPGQHVRVVYRYHWRGGGREVRRRLISVE
ncbi:hypothetical protein GGR28_002974 [Lewinella aquimaris]|uniref:Uncharacterized protein n=1 Tax=Neolewinella aquimaris TaxID=1835722 RepID=A0A840E5J7_9BACT|nr:hypothetical protein [Neolewinella aquimaris]MBB4080340.1 hypothetical protein [Neolewinella aquimaris]